MIGIKIPVDVGAVLRIVPQIRPSARRVAPLAELVDAPDSKSGSARSAGSIPARGTKILYLVSLITVWFLIKNLSITQQIYCFGIHFLCNKACSKLGNERYANYVQRKKSGPLSDDATEYLHVCSAVRKLAIDLDSPAPAIRISLGTRDLAMAGIKRDACEEADNALWGAYLGGDNRSKADARYRTAVARARALDFTYRPVADMMASEAGDQIMV